MELRQQEAAAPAAATDTLECRSGLHDSTVQDALLHHPGVSQDQQVVLALLQASKQLQAAVAGQCAGQVPVVLRARGLQQARIFSQHWLPKHGGLLRELEVQLGHSDRFNWSYSRRWSIAAEAVATALEQQQHLQAFCLRGLPADPILQHLPAACLTRLCVYVDINRTCSHYNHNCSSIAALARLTGLRSLDLRDSDAASCEDFHAALEPIAALQQLTELCLGTVTHEQLQLLRLPPLLQCLDVSVALWYKPKHLEGLAVWLKQHGSIVRRLVLETIDIEDETDEEEEQGVDGPQTQLQWAAAVRHIAKTASAPAAAGASMQLESFTMDTLDAGPILQCLAPSRLTHLHCKRRIGTCTVALTTAVLNSGTLCVHSHSCAGCPWKACAHSPGEAVMLLWLSSHPVCLCRCRASSS